MPRSALSLAVFALFALSAPLSAQPGLEPLGQPASKLPKGFTKLADVTVDVTPTKAKWGETVTVRLTVAPKAGGWTYPAFPADALQKSRNSIEPPAPGDLVFIGAITDPSVAWDKKPREGATNGEQDQYTKKPVMWELKAVVSPFAKAGAKTILLDKVLLQVCDEQNCYPGDGRKLPPVAIEIVEGASDKVKVEDLAAALEVLKVAKPVLPPPAPGQINRGGPERGPSNLLPSSGDMAQSEVRKNAKAVEVYSEELKTFAASISSDEGDNASGTGKQTGLWAFILTAALWGLISLVTPCVFPMIPITVSIFMHRSHGSLRERLKLAGVYSLTIIIVLGISAFALLKFMAWLSVHPITNILLGALFFVLALSLFGMYELTLPNSLQKRLQAKQSQGGVVGTIFGALAFTVISFTCVAPFLGGFAGISAGNNSGGSLIVVPTIREIAGGLAFATAFAAPFFVLALIPGLMKALPKSGGWLDSVKVVMGFLELAAALVFLRTAELGLLSTPQYFTYDVVLGGWVVISATCGLYLLNVFRLPHDEEKSNIGVPRLLFALMFLGLAVYLAPALFKGHDGKPQRPSGVVYAWVESFLLPDTIEEGWRTDLKDTIAASNASGKPVFVDFTGVTCKNCKYNEQNVFSKGAIADDLRKYERVQLYTDWVPETAYQTDPGFPARKAEAAANRDFQLAVFKDIKLPLYAVLMPQKDGKLKLIATYEEGKINNPAEFADFLKTSLEKAKPKK